MTPTETILEAKFEDLLTKIAELEAEIKFLQLNPRPVETLLRSEVEHIEIELANRPIVWAIQHIHTKEIHRGCFVGLYESVEAAESAIQLEFDDPELWAVIVYTGRHINETDC